MLLSDCWIFSPSVDASDNLCFKIKMKKWDWNDATKALIYNTYNEWKTLDLEVVWLSEKTDEHCPECWKSNVTKSGTTKDGRDYEMWTCDDCDIRYFVNRKL